MRNNLIYLILSAFLWSSCNKDESELYSDYVRQFKETIQILDQNNDKIYTDYESLLFEYQEKIKPWHNKVNKVKEKKESIILLLDSILRNKEINEKQLDRNTSIQDWEINSIRQNFDEYRKTLISLIRDSLRYPELIKETKNILSINHLDSINVFKCQSVSKAELLACFYKLKLDITIAESYILNYLYSQVDIDNYRFSNIEAFVVPNSQVLPSGYPYRAEIFLSAYDTTISADYEIEGKKFETISGIGYYKQRIIERPGIYTKNGNFMIKSPYTGEYQKYPFIIKYEVLEKK